MATIIETTIESAIQDKHNANKGTARGEAVLDASLSEFGAGRSLLLDKNYELIAGNKTQIAAMKAGLKKLVIVQTTGDEVVAVQRTDLDLQSETDKRARLLAYYDNRSQELDFELDLTQLSNDIASGLNLSGLWDENELSELLGENNVNNTEGVKELNISQDTQSTIILSYNSEDFIRVKQALNNIAPSPEQAVLFLLFGNNDES